MNELQQQNDEIRGTANAIAHRIIDEPDFREQIKENPHSALTGAGLPEEAVDEFLREWRSGIPEGDEVSGYIVCHLSCLMTCTTSITVF